MCLLKFRADTNNEDRNNRNNSKSPLYGNFPQILFYITLIVVFKGCNKISR